MYSDKIPIRNSMIKHIVDHFVKEHYIDDAACSDRPKVLTVEKKEVHTLIEECHVYQFENGLDEFTRVR